MRTALLLLAICPVMAQAQSWCPPGATWTYSGLISQYPTNRITRYIGDTILAGENAQTLFTVHQFIHPITQLVDTFGGEGVNSWTRVSEDLVWLWSSSEGAWDTLYYFGAVPGSEWGPPFAEPDLCGSAENGDMVQVVDTGTLMVEGLSLRYWDIHLGSYGGRIVERMGWSVMLELFEGCWQDLISEFKCYADNEISYSLDQGPGSCDLATQVEDRVLDEPTIYPNPGTDQFTMQLPPGLNAIVVNDALGRSVFTQQTGGSSFIVDTAHLPSGTYLVRTINASGSAAFKWTKQ